MQIKSLPSRTMTMFAGIACLVLSHVAAADPPSRVGRLGYLSGQVSFSPAGENDWAQAAINRPLTPGDRLWTDAHARAEIQVGGAMIRLDAFTGVTVLNLDDRITQLQLTQGTMNVRVRRLDATQSFEVDTPNLAFSLRQAGDYRIAVDADGNATTIVVRKGQGEAWGDNAAYLIDSRQPYRFMGTNLRDLEVFDAPRQDEFDRWSGERDRRYDNSPSARYVSADVVGYQDLDANGSWRSDATYGNVWYPNRVSADWAPYRDGHWAWIDPWGWTWVDDAPWGFAVSHYGRWANVRGAWGWIPGPVQSRAYYAPALVAFVGGDNFQLRISSGNVGGIAWFPLAPREVYRPAYPVSRGYFENINRSNTVINTTIINNTYNNTNVTNVVYANRQVQGAVVAMPATAFVQSQRVSANAVRLPAESQAGTGTPVSWVPHLAPTEKSVHGAAVQAGKPPGRVFERPVVARTAPPRAHAGFAAQQPQLAAMQGKPLDESARNQLKPAATTSAPVVNVISPAQQAPVAVPPPPHRGRQDEKAARPAAPPAPAAAPPTQPAPASAPNDRRERTDERKNIPPAPAATPPGSPTPPAPPQRGTPVQPNTPATSSPPNEHRGKPEAKYQTPRPVPDAVPPVPAPVPKALPPAALPPTTVTPPTATPPPAPPAGPVAAPPAQRPPRAMPEPAPAARDEARPRATPPASPPPPVQPQAEAKGHQPKTAGDKADEKKKEKADKEAKDAKKHEDEHKQKD